MSIRSWSRPADLDGARLQRTTRDRTCSTQLQGYQRVQIVGTRGRIEIEIPFNAPADRPCRIAVDRTGDVHGSGVEMIAFDTCDQFTIQAEEFSRAILENRPQPAPLEDASQTWPASTLSSARHAAADGRAYEEHCHGGAMRLGKERKGEERRNEGEEEGGGERGREEEEGEGKGRRGGEEEGGRGGKGGEALR